jgi:hypothetical protein
VLLQDRPDYMLSAAATGARAGVLCARMKIQAAGGDSTSHVSARSQLFYIFFKQLELGPV